MQTRRHSLFEQLANTAFGFIVSLLTWEFVVKPIWELHTDFVQNLSITLLFTVISIARGYVCRRLFNCLNNKNNKEDKPCYLSESPAKPGAEKTP